MKKRIICTLLTLIMVCGLFVGCGNKGKETTNSGEGNVLKVGIPKMSTVSDFDDNAFTKYIEESLGIEIEFTFFQGGASERARQLSLMCASNQELPDVLWGFKGHGDNMNAYGEDGYLIDLTDLIDEHAVNYKKGLKGYDKEMQERIKHFGTCLSDGAFYGMPVVGDYGDDANAFMVYVNKQWLDAVGMSIPTTTDELYNVLKAFKTQDPNGNGEKDEIPMLGSVGSFACKGTITDYVMNAFVCYDNEDIFNVTDGKVWTPANTDEWRQGIAYINKLVSEGLMSDASFSISSSTEYVSTIIGTDEVPKVGVFAAHSSIFLASQTSVLSQYVVVPALADATGKGGYAIENDIALEYSGFITKDCEDVELAMKFLDFFYTDETCVRMNKGEPGVDWVESEGTAYTGKPANVKVLNENVFTEGNSTWHILGLGFLSVDKYAIIVEEQTGVWKDYTRLRGEVYDAIMKGRKVEETTSVVRFDEEEKKIEEEYWSTYTSHIRSFLARCAVGQANINDDTVWKSYLSDLEAKGEKELLKIVQSAYDRYEK